MGLDKTAAEALAAAKSLGADFTNCAMIGRQSFRVPAKTLHQIAELFGASEKNVSGPYSEPFFRMLGAQTVESIDMSDYEQASIIHDMNVPLPDHLKARFDLVFDGGSLEHVFNVPEALKSCMDMLRVGGTFVQLSCANNFMGHGFWQLSPELLYRVFSSENGFQVQSLLLQELPLGPRGRRFGKYIAVRDPAEVGARVLLTNRRPTYIVTIARKVDEVEVFQTFPQQSDYVVHWSDRGASDPRPSPKRRLIDTVRRFLPDDLERGIRPRFAYKAYRRLSPDAFMRGEV